jgi:calcium-dependent protein kinase
LELCTGGEVFDKIGLVGNFTERVAANLFRQMMSAVSHCHKRKVCHKDLKPENFLFETPESTANIKLIDFGLSELFVDSSKALQ